MYKITQRDITRVFNLVHDIWPDIEPRDYMWAELESAALLGLTEAAGKYDGQTPWQQYSQRMVVWRCKDMMRVEYQRPSGITGGGRGDHDIELYQPECEDDPRYNRDVSEMVEHSLWPDPGEIEQDAHLQFCVAKILDTYPFEPEIFRQIWCRYWEGYSSADIAKMLDITESYVSMALAQCREGIMEELTRLHYSKYPYPE